MKLTLFVLASALCFAQGTLSLANPGPIPPAGYLPGATVTLNVAKTGNATATALQFDMVATVGSGSVQLSIGASSTTTGKTIVCSPTTPFRCLVFGLANTTPLADGTVAIATVTMPTPAAGPVTITLSNPIEADANGNSLAVTVGNPTVLLSPQNRCDVNGDGSVSSADTSAVVNQAITKASTAATDLNSDSKADVLDAQIAATAASGGACNAH